MRFAGLESGNMVLPSTVEAHVVFYAPTALLGGQSWSEGTKVHGA